MVFEDLGITNIASQCIDRPMPAHVHHLENRGAAFGSGCQETGPQGVASEQCGIEADPLGMRFDDVCHALVSEPIAQLAALADRAEQWPGGERRSASLHYPQRAQHRL
jgi:hypothetical protein